MSERYYLSQDNDSHWYLVPLRLTAEWAEWLKLPSDNPDSWEAPEGIVRIGGSYESVTFAEPLIDGRFLA